MTSHISVVKSESFSLSFIFSGLLADSAKKKFGPKTVRTSSFGLKVLAENLQNIISFMSFRNPSDKLFQRPGEQKSKEVVYARRTKMERGVFYNWPFPSGPRLTG